MTTSRQVGGWVTGLVLFAGVMMIMIGVYQTIIGARGHCLVIQFYSGPTPAYAYQHRRDGVGMAAPLPRYLRRRGRLGGDLRAAPGVAWSVS